MILLFAKIRFKMEFSFQIEPEDLFRGRGTQILNQHFM